MTIFWDPEDQRWCDECDEYLQQYHSLALQDEQVIHMKNYAQAMKNKLVRKGYRSCRMKLR